MHAKDDIRLIKILEALSFSFGVLKYNYNNLYNNCIDIPNSNENLIAALSSCWSIIDSVHRIREISQAIPGLSKKNNDLKIFLASTKKAEDFRHYFQHLRSELSKIPPNGFPVFGSLSWIDNEDITKCHTILLGAKVGKQSHYSCPFDTRNNRWATKVCLSINKTSFLFDPVFAVSKNFHKKIMSWIKDTFDKEIKVKTKIPILTSQIKIVKDDN